MDGWLGAVPYLGVDLLLGRVEQAQAKLHTEQVLHRRVHVLTHTCSTQPTTEPWHESRQEVSCAEARPSLTWSVTAPLWWAATMFLW